MNKTWIKWLSLVLALTCLVPAAMAETGNDPVRARSQMTRFNADRTQMTADQKAAYDSALSDYAAAEDQALQGLVQAGDIEQQRVDRFQAMRDMQGAMSSLEMGNWTDAERQQFQDATALQGDERTAALNALVSSGLLTQRQADALASGGGFRNRMRGNGNGQAQDGAETRQFDPENMPDGFDPDNAPEDMDPAAMPDGAGQRQSTDIWSDIMSMERTDSIQRALSAIQAAQQVFLAALEGAGISLQTN